MILKNLVRRPKMAGKYICIHIFKKLEMIIYMYRTYGSLYHFIFLLQRVKIRCYNMARAYGSAKSENIINCVHF